MASNESVFVEMIKESDNCEEMDTNEGLEEGELKEVAPVKQSLAKKRFPLVGNWNFTVHKDELNSLYNSLSIDEENERHYRFNTLHLRGTQKMETRDVYKYFSLLEPFSVSWLGEGVCNVVWNDENKPAKALLLKSTPVPEDDEMMPPGRWRRGHDAEKSNRIIMRYASKDDRRSKWQEMPKKKPKHKEITVKEWGKNPWGEIASSWGKNEGIEPEYYLGAPGHNVPDLRKSLNHIVEQRLNDGYLSRGAMIYSYAMNPPCSDSDSSSNSDSDSNFVMRRKLPKMHADREEERLKLVRMETAMRAGDLRAKLNRRKLIPRRFRRDPAPSDESDSSMDYPSESYNDLRQSLRNRPVANPESDVDLSEPEMLQIEVDNEYCQSPPN